MDIVRSLFFKISIFNIDITSSRLLSKHQDVQAKIRAEIQETFGSSPAEVSITRQMPYLTNVLKEGKFSIFFVTLRVKNPNWESELIHCSSTSLSFPPSKFKNGSGRCRPPSWRWSRRKIPSPRTKGRGCGSVCLLHAPSHRHIWSRCHCLPTRQMGEWCA
jgi:hypothetical protein